MENVALVTLNNKITQCQGSPMPVPTKFHTAEISLKAKLLAAGLAACMADLVTFPLDTAKVRLQIQGEALATQSASGAAKLASGAYSTAAGTAGSAGASMAAQYRGVLGTICTISRLEGPKALYNGIVPGLQRQMAFASIRIGLYDSVKHKYQQKLGSQSGAANVGVRILAGVTTGAFAVSVAQPTDVVKVRMQAQKAGAQRYPGCFAAYRAIGQSEGLAGLWKGTSPNIARTTIVNACELVSYDLIKEKILALGVMSDNMPCHFVSAFGAGFVTTVVASPVDVVKTRYMNSGLGTYSGIVDCATTMYRKEGLSAFYKGFMPSFLRLGSWNIVMFVCYEQLKRAFANKSQSNIPNIEIRVPKTQVA